MPPVRPRDAKTFLKGAFALVTTALDFLGDREDGVHILDASEKAIQRFKKRTSKGTPSKKKRRAMRSKSTKVVEAEVIDVEGETVQ